MDITQIVIAVLGLILTPLIGAAVKYLFERIGTERLARIREELAAKQELADLAVRFVEQAYRDYKGDAKLQAACDWLADRAKEKGIALGSEEIRGLIEAALRLIKDEFGEEWAKAGAE